MPTLEEKLKALQETLQSYGKVAVAFSAGVDSTFLLAVAHEVLRENALAITVQSPVVPAREHDEALSFCSQRGIRHIVFSADQFSVEGFAANPPDRCYICKRSLFESICNKAHSEGFNVVVDGSNNDDLSDYRPGHKALQELSIQSPLVECGFSKQDIRDASAAMGLSTATKQSFACLATRIPYGETITPEKLARIDTAEQILLDLGLSVVRVRLNGSEGRIETKPEDFELVLKNREQIIAGFATCGLDSATLDLRGYRTGSMNEGL